MSTKSLFTCNAVPSFLVHSLRYSKRSRCYFLIKVLTYLIFLQPNSIRVMGDKSTARETMKNAGVPTVPGSDGLLKVCCLLVLGLVLVFYLYVPCDSIFLSFQQLFLTYS